MAAPDDAVDLIVVGNGSMQRFEQTAPTPSPATKPSAPAPRVGTHRRRQHGRGSKALIVDRMDDQIDAAGDGEVAGAGSDARSARWMAVSEAEHAESTAMLGPWKLRW